MSITVNPRRKRRPVLVAGRGLPGCGLHVVALSWVRADPDWRVRITRRELREMGHGSHLGTGAQEAIVSGLQGAGVRTALANGTSVFVDDTNLRESDINTWSRVAAEMDAGFEVYDLRDVDVEVCVARDAQRDVLDQVGEDEIRRLHTRHILAGSGAKTLPAPTRTIARG